MKVLLTFTLFLLCSSALAKFQYDMSKPARSLWMEYLTNHGLVFAASETQHRFEVFKQNIGTINYLNKLYGPDVEFGLTKFAHLTPAEFKDRYLTLDSDGPLQVKKDDPVTIPQYSEQHIRDLPKTFDWREKGAVTDVKDQGQCGSCWAFSTTGNVEGVWFLAGNPLTPLSEQNLVDCDHECDSDGSCDDGCNGGLMGNAMNYIIQNKGIATEEAYPYEGVDGTCSYDPKTVGAKISNWTFVGGPEGNANEEQMAAYLVSRGPLSIAVDATIWQFYFGGVIYVPCGTSLNHGVLIVGYGTETNVFGSTIPFWNIKNSWGTGWGEDGYVRVQRGNGKCGVNLYVVSAIV